MPWSLKTKRWWKILGYCIRGVPKFRPNLHEFLCWDSTSVPTHALSTYNTLENPKKTVDGDRPHCQKFWNHVWKVLFFMCELRGVSWSITSLISSQLDWFANYTLSNPDIFWQKKQNGTLHTSTYQTQIVLFDSVRNPLTPRKIKEILVNDGTWNQKIAVKMMGHEFLLYKLKRIFPWVNPRFCPIWVSQAFQTSHRSKDVPWPEKKNTEIRL